jgi:hypothetical protein
MVKPQHLLSNGRCQLSATLAIATGPYGQFPGCLMERDRGILPNATRPNIAICVLTA